MGVFNEEGVLVRSYAYDAWGVVKATIHNNTGTNANSRFNPFFYRGYYYDAQLGLYYLNSRYYDPQTCRFISPDGYVSTGHGLNGYNMFAYCNNNPVMLSDYNGEFPWLIVGLIVAAVIVVPTVVNHIVNAVNVKNIEGEIEETYSEEEMKKVIKEINSDVDIEFKEDGVTITNSRKVKSRYDRQKICMIISRTVELDREIDNMSSEWLFHNVMYFCHIKRDSADPADLEYNKDSRWYVRFVTKSLEILGWE